MQQRIKALGFLSCMFCTILCRAGGDKAAADAEPPDNYALVIADGKKNIPEVREMIAIWPKSKHLITHFTGEFGPTIWQSAVPLYGRYTLVVQINITLNKERTKITKAEKAVFLLSEIAAVKYDPVTRTESVTPGEASKEFDEKEWEKVVKSKGRLEELGVKIRKDAPVEGFDEYVDRNFGSWSD